MVAAIRTGMALSPGRRPLRFALLCETPCLAAWQASCLDLLLASECAQLVLLITTAERDARRPPGVLEPTLRPVRSRRRHPLWRLCHRQFTRRATALKTIDCSARIAAADRLECTVIEDERGFPSLGDRDLTTAEAYDLDFILKFGLGVVRGRILTAARYGVWSYDHDHDRGIAAAPTGFWEIMRREPTTVATLRRLMERPYAQVVLHRAIFATHWRLPTNYDQVAFGAVDGCLRVCRALLGGDQPTPESAPADATPCLPQTPGNRQVVSFVFNQMSGYLRAKFVKHFCRDEWNVGIVDAPLDALLSQGQLRRVRWLGPKQRDAYLADPIVLDTSDRCRFLAELFDYGGRAKGSIVRCDLDADGKLSVVPFLDADCHLSYPFVLHDENGWYLIPETSERAAVLIYPIGVDGIAGPPAVLLEGRRVDATVVRHDHRWWLFCSEGSLKLLAFHADRLRGPWTPHRLNPLKTDVTSARPAGPLFERNGALFRPAQDGSLGYGAAVVIHRIVELTPERFREEQVGRIDPDVDGPYPEGFHTINLLGERCLVDGKRTVFDPTWVLRGRIHGRKVRARRARLRAAAQLAG